MTVKNKGRADGISAEYLFQLRQQLEQSYPHENVEISQRRVTIRSYWNAL